MPKVQAYVYDITNGMASRMSLALLGKQLDVVPHTGIVAFGKEFFFGSGPCIGEPGKSVPVAVNQVLDLGDTDKTCEELEAYIAGVLAKEHTSENYNLLSHNCNHFANDVAKFLLDGRGIPEWIVNIAQEALSGPRGQALRRMIEKLEQDMRTGMGSSFNPFGDAGTPIAEPAAAAGSNPELELALQEIASKNAVDVKRAALQTLAKITENVAKNPAEQKFRQIKMENAAFTKKVAACDGAVDAMIAAGWVPDTTPEGVDMWLMPDEPAMRQALPRRRFAEELAKLPGAPAPAAPAAPAPSFPMAPHAGGFGGGAPGGGLGPPGGLDPQAMQQAMQQMQGNPQMMQQMQQMQNNPQMMAQMQQMMQDPQMMAQMQQMMGGMGGMGGMPGFNS